MSTDLVGPPPMVTTYVPHPTDLETIVVLLELAAIHLTPTVGALFTFHQLFAQANVIGGGEVVLDKRDAAIVAAHAHFLKKTGRHLQLV